jgi:arsenate reductase
MILNFQDIKQDPITLEELEQMRELAGSYEHFLVKKHSFTNQWI